MLRNDSLDKIFQVYFASVTRDEFEYKGKTYYPKNLQVSPNLIRTMRCPPFCGGCCFKFSLDYLPDDIRLVDQQTEREVQFNGKAFKIFSDFQTDNQSDRCKHLKRDDGRCKIHGYHPLTCQFETLRFKMSDKPEIPNHLGNQPYGRGWSYNTIDGGRGARCIFNNHVSLVSCHAVHVKLLALKKWAEYFGVRHKLDEIIKMVKMAPLHWIKEPIIL